MKKRTPLQDYHGRRFALAGAIAILKSTGAFTEEIRNRIHWLEHDIKKANWVQYQKEKTPQQ